LVIYFEVVFLLLQFFVQVFVIMAPTKKGKAVNVSDATVEVSVGFVDGVVDDVDVGVASGVMSVVVAEVPEPALLAVVSPEKPVKARRVFCVYNRLSMTFMKAQSKSKAEEYVEISKKLDPERAPNLVVQDFSSFDEMESYFETLIPSGHKDADVEPKEPAEDMIPPAVVAVVPPVGVASSVIKRPSLDAAVLSVPKLLGKRPKLGGRTAASAATHDANLAKYKEAFLSSNTRMEVFHMVMTGASYDVWGFSLKENDRDYWAWKPFVLDKAIAQEATARLFASEGTTMDDLLFSVSAANKRATPRGPNVASTFPIKGGRSMNHQILFGFLPSPSSEESVRKIGLEFANQCEEPRIRGAYAVAMENVMKNQAIIKDCDPVSGTLWKKMSSGGKNIVYCRLVCLSEVVCDDTIEQVMQTLYSQECIGGESSSLWHPNMRELAFGPPASTTEASI
jgi:hypothetical protein